MLSTVNTVIHNTTELLKYLPLCDVEAANYFGLLAKGDCIAVSYLLDGCLPFHSQCTGKEIHKDSYAGVKIENSPTNQNEVAFSKYVPKIKITK